MSKTPKCDAFDPFDDWNTLMFLAKQIEEKLTDAKSLLEKCRDIHNIPHELYDDIQNFLN